MRMPAALAVVLSLAGALHAEDAPEAPAALTTEQAVERVLAAWKAGGGEALRAVAALDDPDPWVVADELIRHGEHEAAGAFAAAAPRKYVERLPAYVASRRGVADDPERRKRLAAGRAALAADDAAGAQRAVGEPEAAPPTDVLGVRLGIVRAIGLEGVDRLADAHAAYGVAGEAAEKLGWWACAAWAYESASRPGLRATGAAAALVACERALAMHETLGDRAAAATTLMNIGSLNYRLGQTAKALAAYGRLLAIREAQGDEAGVAQALRHVGIAQGALGEYEAALTTLERALAIHEARKNRPEWASTLGALGNIHFRRGAYLEAVARHERALALFQEARAPEGVEIALNNLANAQMALGAYARARDAYERALAGARTRKDRAGEATSLANLGNYYAAVGEIGKAQGAYEQALAIEKALGNERAAARTRFNIGNFQLSVGNYARARDAYEEALVTLVSLGDREGAAATLGSLGGALRSLGNYPLALERLEQARAAQVGLGDRARAAWTLSEIGNVRLQLGETAKALADFKAALEEQETLGDRAGAARTLTNIGVAHHLRGEYVEALEALQRALTSRRDMGDRASESLVLGNIGLARLALGEPAVALGVLRQAVELQVESLAGLSTEEAAGSREALRDVFAAGVQAAQQAGTVHDVAYFLEMGRALALLAGLQARGALAAAVVPEDLRAEGALARAAQARAAAELSQPLPIGDGVAVKKRRLVALHAARERSSAVVARMEREARSAATLVRPRAAALPDVQAVLAAHEALVLYGLSGDGLVALVVTRERARLAVLGPMAAVTSAVGRLVLDKPTGSVEQPLADLAAKVAGPLALPAEVKRVLISPTGSLAAVPFAALWPDRTVAHVPSGTVLRLLRSEQPAPGDGVLALGDPVYPPRVRPLPGTRVEALAVGTVTLLGSEATEAGLRAALSARPRWRSVHLACHGHVNPEHPAQSALALTAAGDDDGSLTCLDVFGLQVRSDLVVLSACETGVGHVLQTEGIVGLTRAFMHAGTPRVIASLWEVDDEATSVLMRRFYELWHPRDGSPGLAAADALDQAQDHVRGQEKWEHPFFWAAWVLWGAPE